MSIISFISMRTQYENVGDELINCALIERALSLGSVYVLTNGVPNWYIDNITRKLPVDRIVDFNTINDVSEYIRIIFKTLASKDERLLFLTCGDATSRKSNYRLDLAMLLLLKIANLRLVQIGASYSELSDSRKLILRHAKRCSDISVRDPRSVDILNRKGICSTLSADLAFTQDWREGVGSDVCITLRSLPNVSTQAVFDRLEPLISVFKNKGLVVFVTWQVDRDEALNSELARYFGLELKGAPSKSGRLETMATIYQNCSFVVSNRLHALLLGAANGCVPVAFLQASEVKIRGVYEQSNLLSLIYNDRSDNLEDLIANREIIVARVRNSFEKGKGLIDEYFNKIKRDIK